MNLNLAGQHFGALPSAARFFDLASGGNTTTSGQLFYFRFVVGQIPFGDDLDIALAGSVVDFDEAKPGFGVASSPNPALQSAGAADRRFLGER